MADLTRRALLRWGAGAGAGAAGVRAFGALVDPLTQAAPAPFEPPTAGSAADQDLRLAHLGGSRRHQDQLCRPAPERGSCGQ